MDRTPYLYREVIDAVLTEMKNSLESYGWDEETVARKMTLMHQKWESKLAANGCIDYHNDCPLQRTGTPNGPPLSKGEKRKAERAAERANERNAKKLAKLTDNGIGADAATAAAIASAIAAGGGAAAAAVPAPRRKPLSYPTLHPQAMQAQTEVGNTVMNPFETLPPDAKKGRAPRKNAAASSTSNAAGTAVDPTTLTTPPTLASLTAAMQPNVLAANPALLQNPALFFQLMAQINAAAAAAGSAAAASSNGAVAAPASSPSTHIPQQDGADDEPPTAPSAASAITAGGVPAAASAAAAAASSSPSVAAASSAEAIAAPAVSPGVDELKEQIYAGIRQSSACICIIMLSIASVNALWLTCMVFCVFCMTVPASLLSTEVGPEDDDSDDERAIAAASSGPGGSPIDPSTADLLVCQYEKVLHAKDTWKIVLRDGILRINKRDFVFSRATGEFEW
jgi:hypothetical protein